MDTEVPRWETAQRCCCSDEMTRGCGWGCLTRGPGLAGEQQEREAPSILLDNLIAMRISFCEPELFFLRPRHPSPSPSSLLSSPSFSLLFDLLLLIPSFFVPLPLLLLLPLPLTPLHLHARSGCMERENSLTAGRMERENSLNAGSEPAASQPLCQPLVASIVGSYLPQNDVLRTRMVHSTWREVFNPCVCIIPPCVTWEEDDMQHPGPMQQPSSSSSRLGRPARLPQGLLHTAETLVLHMDTSRFALWRELLAAGIDPWASLVEQLEQARPTIRKLRLQFPEGVVKQVGYSQTVLGQMGDDRSGRGQNMLTLFERGAAPPTHATQYLFRPAPALHSACSFHLLPPSAPSTCSLHLLPQPAQYCQERAMLQAPSAWASQVAGVMGHINATGEMKALEICVQGKGRDIKVGVCSCV